MLHDRDSISTFERSNFVIWMLMAFQGGYINAGGYLASHRFVSHITGYATLLPFELVNHNIASAAKIVCIPIFFFMGAMTSGYLVDLRLRLHKPPRYWLSFGLIHFILLASWIAGSLGLFGDFEADSSTDEKLLLAVALAYLCGVQNGTVTSASRAVVRTTHLSGITTDLGIGLVRYAFRKQIGDSASGEGAANQMRVGLISFFVAGSAAGVVTFHALGYDGFLIPIISSGLLVARMLFSRFK